MGAYEDAGQEARARKEKLARREQLQRLLREMPLHDVLIEVRDHVQSRSVEHPQGRAIMVRGIEDVIVWNHALEERVLWTPPVGG